LKLGYFLVEGYDDAELIGTILRKRGLERIKLVKDLYKYWSSSPIIPRGFPPSGDLTKRVPVPLFYQNNDSSVAIHCAEGNLDKMANTIRSTLVSIPNLINNITCLGIFCDADCDMGSTYQSIGKHLTSIQQLPMLPPNCGSVTTGIPRIGVFLFPDNGKKGFMEDILMHCANHSYAEILGQTNDYIDNVDKILLDKDRKKFDLPAGKLKAKVGCISNVLSPGKTIQTSIHDNDWVCDDTLSNTELSSLDNFISNLIFGQ
jgi:hypothetical protein